MRGKNQGLRIRRFPSRIPFFRTVCFCVWLCCRMQGLDGSIQDSLRCGSWTPVAVPQFSCPMACGIWVPLTRCPADTPCFGRGILNHWTPGEVPVVMFYTSAVEWRYSTKRKCKLHVCTATGEISISNMLHSLFNIESLDSTTHFFNSRPISVWWVTLCVL